MNLPSKAQKSEHFPFKTCTSSSNAILNNHLESFFFRFRMSLAKLIIPNLAHFINPTIRKTQFVAVITSSHFERGIMFSLGDFLLLL